MSHVIAVVLNWNGYRKTIRCVESVVASEGVKVEIIVIDNASEDDSYEELRRGLGSERVVALPHNVGYSGGMNAGLQWWVNNSHAKYAVLLTHDVVVDPHAIRNLVRAADEGCSVGVAGPLVYYEQDEGRLFSAGGKIDRKRIRVHHARTIEQNTPYPVRWIDGCCMLVTRNAIEAAGGFDARYFMYWEEVDLATRVREAKLDVIVSPHARVWHEKTMEPPFHYYYYMSRNRYRFWRDNFDIPFGAVLCVFIRQSRRSWRAAIATIIHAKRRSVSSSLFRRAALESVGALVGTMDHLRGLYGRRDGR